MPCLDSPPYDVVIFLLDDMRFDQVAVLEQTVERLEPEAVAFDRAYVTTPMCCPERASFLAGGYYAHQTGVLTNEAPTGGATVFPDEGTLPVRLQQAGYATALVGKYLNEYESLGLYVPPGWTRWAATGNLDAWNHPEFVEGSSTFESGFGAAASVSAYVTSWQGSEILDFLDAHPDEPVFAYLSFVAPHDPHVPAAEDADEFADTVYRDRGYEEADLSDKPAWIQEIGLMSDEELAVRDQANRERLQTLLAVDRAMAAVIDAVRASPRAARTVFVLSSDNGQMWREHRLSDKGVAYEESVRVPLWIAHPDLAAATRSDLVASNLDLAATVAALAGLEPEGEGISLIPTLCDGAGTGREEVLLQAWTFEMPSWSALVTPTTKYIETVGGELELYDLDADPYELESLHEQASAGGEIDELAARLDELRGLGISTDSLPRGEVGEDYEASLGAWGGEAPLTWTLIDGALPAGLALDASGTIHGVPEVEGKRSFKVRVTDSSVSPVHGGPQAWRANLDLVVEPRACGCGTGRPAGLLAAGLALWAAMGRRRATGATGTGTGARH